jgi:putative transposase
MEQTHAYRRDAHRVHLISSHLIWCPRRRKPVLVGPVAARCRELLKGQCTEKGWERVALASQPAPRHLCVRVWPSERAADVVKDGTGMTSFHLRTAFAHMLTLPSTWTRSSCATTAGTVSQETMQRYLAAQIGR